MVSPFPTHRSRFARAVPVLQLVVGGLTNLLTPEPYTGLPLLASAPLVAGMLYSFKSTGLFILLSCAATAGLDLVRDRPPTPVLIDILVLLLVSTIGLWTKTVTVRQSRHLALARDIAEAAQLAVLPVPPPQVGPLRVAYRYQPAQAEARVGGDFYAVQCTSFGVRAVIGDVRGKGLQAVSLVSVAVGAFRENADREPTLHALAGRLDRALEKDAEDRGDPAGQEGFTTALLVQIDPRERVAHLLNRGHTPPYLIENGEVRSLEPRVANMPLAIGLGDVSAATPADAVPFSNDTFLLLVTDGVTEARDPEGVFYDPCDGLAGRGFEHPEALLDTVLAQLTRWTGGERQDDVAMLALSAVGMPAAAATADDSHPRSAS